MCAGDSIIGLSVLWRIPCKTKRANSGIGALFRGGLLRIVTHYYARRGRVITRLSVNKHGRTPKFERCSAQTWVCQYAVMRERAFAEKTSRNTASVECTPAIAGGARRRALLRANVT